MNDHKVAIITGGRTGIGFAALKHFKAQGYTTINISRKPASLEGCINLTADFTIPGWEKNIASDLESTIAEAGQVILVHNAGLHISDSAMTIDPDAMRRSLDVNVVAPAILNKMINPHLCPGSAILYVGSTLSEKAVAGLCFVYFGKARHRWANACHLPGP